MAAIGLASLPGEILLHIISFLEPAHITNLQLVCSAFRILGRDNSFWRARCFDESSFLEALDRRRLLMGDTVRQAVLALGDESATGTEDGARAPGVVHLRNSRKRERARIMANWDPTYPSERQSWYEEYIQRHGPIAINWLQEARPQDDVAGDMVEARGVALYHPDNPHQHEATQEGAVLAVSPLDDGSVCIWDINGTRGKRGAILSRSAPGILFVDGPGDDNNRRSRRVDSGVTECVSVDSTRHRAFFAVQCHLIEVDLQRLAVVDCDSLPWSITALSVASPSVPLTIGTSQGVHLHDYRLRSNPRADSTEIVDTFDQMTARDLVKRRNLRYLFEQAPLPPYAPLSQPTPLSILHLQRPGLESDLSDEIYVAGRFSSILLYDRRKFPAIRGSIHSGARLCSMASLPYRFSALDSELRQKGELSLKQVETSKATTGRTLMACGEYNTKGSLELYGLTPTSTVPPNVAGGLQNSVLKNRQTSSQSKLLSVVNHGTRIAVSDGTGYVKWFERDGFTEVRRCRIGHSEQEETPSLFASMPGSDEIARKLIPTRVGTGNGRVNDNDLLFWTGEKLGVVGFSARPGFAASDFEERMASAEDDERAKQERAHAEKMRRALEWQADNVRFVRNLGWRSGVRG
ncbi:hypothetical protein GQ53DRAFT_306456 [Thozetella sp. PMI_491]|nr:hypothetical protein GQ53DRAFT_306456 [Thozetella sp. PMI_491]